MISCIRTTTHHNLVLRGEVFPVPDSAVARGVATPAVLPLAEHVAVVDWVDRDFRASGVDKDVLVVLVELFLIGRVKAAFSLRRCTNEKKHKKREENRHNNRAAGRERR